MRKFLPRNDHVRNKDRQDPAAVISLADEKLIEYLRPLNFVSHTVIPEMDHFIEHKSVEMYSHPIKFIYMAQLHNPVRKVEVLKESVTAKEVHFKNNVVFLAGNDGQIKFHEVVKGSVCVDVNKLRNRGEVLEKLNELGFAPGGSVVEMKSRH